MEDAQGIVLTAHSAGLSITTFGKSHTYPGHYYGPAMRPYYLIHYILSGKGSFPELSRGLPDLQTASGAGLPH